MDNKRQQIWIILLFLYNILGPINAQMFAAMQPQPIPVYPQPILAPVVPVLPAVAIPHPPCDTTTTTTTTAASALEAVDLAMVYPVPYPVPMPMPAPIIAQPLQPAFCLPPLQKPSLNGIECPPCPPCLCKPACTPQFFSYCSPCHQICRCRNIEDVPKPLPPNLVAPVHMALPPMPPPVVMLPIFEFDSDLTTPDCCVSRYKRKKIKKRKRKKICKFKYGRECR